MKSFKNMILMLSQFENITTPWLSARYRTNNILLFFGI